MTEPLDLILDAFAKLNDSVTKEDGKLFATGQVEDVWEIICKIRQGQFGTEIRDVSRAERFLRVIEKYSQHMRLHFRWTPYLNFVWAQTGFMLQQASVYNDLFDSLLGAFAEFCDALPEFDHFVYTFEHEPEFRYTLAAVYISIATFYRHLYKLFQGRGWHVLFLPRFSQIVWNKPGIFTQIILFWEELLNFATDMRNQINTTDGSNVRVRALQNMVEIYVEDIKYMEQELMDDHGWRPESSIRWLALDDGLQQTTYNRLMSWRHDGTCDWIMETPEMKAWLTDDGIFPILPLLGNLGTGKSTICARVIDVLKQTPGLTTCYYLCTSEEPTDICSEILRTVAFQMVNQHLDLNHLIGYYCWQEEADCDLEKLQFLMPLFLEVLPYTRIVIDGLEKCSKDDQKAVLKYMQSLSIARTTRCKILFSTRLQATVREMPFNCYSIQLNYNIGIRLDMSLYISAKLKSHGLINEGLFERLNSILMRANRTFLWIRLAVGEITRSCFNTNELITNALRFPDDLEEAYGAIFNRVMDIKPIQHLTSIKRQILEWICYSYRPLKSFEIFQAISMDNTDALTILNMSNFTRNSSPGLRNLDVLVPLVEEGPSRIAAFIHPSARDYILAWSRIDAEEAQMNITLACVTYLNNAAEDLMPWNSTDKKRAELILSGKHDLHLYATRFWYEHLFSYLEKIGKRGEKIHWKLEMQLVKLVRHRKVAQDESRGPATNYPDAEIPNLAWHNGTLDRLPGVKDLILDMLSFRKNWKRKQAMHQPEPAVSHESCVADTTYFSTYSYYYNLTVEALMDGKSIPAIEPKQLQDFKQIHKYSTFVCPYLHCVRSTDGFSSLEARDEHIYIHKGLHNWTPQICIPNYCPNSACKIHCTKWHRVSPRDRQKYPPTVFSKPSSVENELIHEPGYWYEVFMPTTHSTHLTFESPKNKQGEQAYSSASLSPLRQQPPEINTAAQSLHRMSSAQKEDDKSETSSVGDPIRTPSSCTLANSERSESPPEETERQRQNSQPLNGMCGAQLWVTHSTRVMAEAEKERFNMLQHQLMLLEAQNKRRMMIAREAEEAAAVTNGNVPPT